MKNKFDTPIVLIIFNRYESIKKVIDSLREIKPSEIYVIADGPRENKENEYLLCEQTRKAIDEIDWEANIYKNYSNKNLGCRDRIYSGLNWVFDNVEKAIILEDDCVPNREFFNYAEQMLDFYENDERIFSIEGTNVCGEWKSNENSYHFSKYAALWGWATWKRAWSKIDLNFKSYQENKKKLRSKLSFSQYKTFDIIFRKTKNHEINSWGYAWIYSILINDGLTVVPSRNLIKNIGFGENATHTHSKESKLSGLNNEHTLFNELNNNNIVTSDDEYDDNYFVLHHNPNLLRLLVPNFVKSGIKSIIKIAKKS